MRANLRRYIRIIVILAIIIAIAVSIAIIILSGKTSNQPSPKTAKTSISNMAAPVFVAKVQKADVPLYLKTVGTVSPKELLTVKTQINGRLLKIYFKEGQFVKKGDILAQIDPQSYEALLKQYEGQLIRDKALWHNALLDKNRYIDLYKKKLITQQVLDTQIHLVRQYEGVIKIDEGLIDGTKVNLEYCKIKSNIDGIIGLIQVTEGNFLQTSDTTPLTTITQVSPIEVIFTIPEDDIVKIPSHYVMRSSPHNKRGVAQDTANPSKVVVDAFNKKGDKLLESGELLAIDSQIDSTTGTIKLKGIFKNSPPVLYPNQFVVVRIKVGTLSSALTIPAAAVQIGSENSYVYKVTEDPKTGIKSVSTIPVTVKTRMEDQVVIEGALQEGEIIVIQGQDKLTPGKVVTIREMVSSPLSPIPASQISMKKS